jgi:SAM-dependent methyltransferase
MFVDAAKYIDTLKIRLYTDFLYQSDIYEEGESDYHKSITEKIVTEIVHPLEMTKDAAILDIGCGPGYFLDAMKTLEYTNLTGITLSVGDYNTCKKKGHRVMQYDMSFLPHTDGFLDESADFIFLRHVLEHSPYPIFSLIEYNRLLKQGSYMYIETPAPDTDRLHEFARNHYSILGKTQIAALLKRTGFEIKNFKLIDFDLTLTDNDTGESKPVHEQFYSFLVYKKFNLDIK